MEDFLLFLFGLSFSVSLILADSVSIRDPIARITFHKNSHSLIRYKSILFLSLALLLLYRSEYNGSTKFALKTSQLRRKEKGFDRWSGWSRGGGAVYCTVLTIKLLSTY